MSSTDFERIAVTVVELDLDTCSNTFGVSPCTAGRVHSGTATAGSANTITLAAGASSVTDAYKNMAVRLTGGTGSGQEKKITAYNGTTKVATVDSNWTTNPDATSTYNVINRPAACYNTWKTCQDKPNYVKSTKTLKFCSEGTPLPAGIPLRPYINQLSSSPTIIDPQAGLSRRATASVMLADEPDNDAETDPYVTWRTTDAAGTFWARLLARNHNYVGRFARLRRGFAVSPWDWGQFVDELYVIDSIRGPDRNGSVTITLKDPIKLTDRAKIPTPTDGKLNASINATDLSLVLNSGAGAQYGSTGYVRIDDEIIQYTSKSTDTLSWPSTAYRGKFGTTASTHNQNNNVQQCKAYIAQAWTDVIKSILNDSGITNTYIDTAGFTAEETDYLGAKFNVTTILSEPEDPSKYLEELAIQSNAVIWWSPIDQKVKYKVVVPRLGVGTTGLTDEANIIDGSVAVDSLDDQRLTMLAFYYGMKDYAKNKDEVSNFALGINYIDTDAESANEYNDRRPEVIYSQWLGAGNEVAVSAVVARRINFFRNAPKRLQLQIDPKDNTRKPGDLVDVQTVYLPDNGGNAIATRSLITKQDNKETHVVLEVLTTNFRRRYGYIAPAGYPDYASATAAQREYAFICTSAGKMSDGTDGYYTF